jgi:hypothetical protein
MASNAAAIGRLGPGKKWFMKSIDVGKGHRIEFRLIYRKVGLVVVVKRAVFIGFNALFFGIGYDCTHCSYPLSMNNIMNRRY